MLIDWFTVVAQAVNFLALVWLLKRFLYKPILKAIDEREKGIAAQLAEAAAQKAEAQKEREELQYKHEEFDRHRGELLRQAADAAKAERQRLLEETRKEFDFLRSKWQEALRDEQAGLTEEIARRIYQEVLAIVRKVLADLAGVSLEERICAVFIQRLRDLNAGAKAQLTAALKTSPHPALVRSTYDLPPAQRAAIEDLLKERFACEVGLQFERTPDLVGSIELLANGHKLAWSIADYLTSFEKSIGELLQEKPGSKGADEHVA